MARRSYFEDLGIYGWGQIEPVILSAIIADKSILFIGDHGSNKTEACEVIAKAVLGNIEFRHYEVPHLNFDDLLGYRCSWLNPCGNFASRMAGHFRWVLKICYRTA